MPKTAPIAKAKATEGYGAFGRRETDEHRQESEWRIGEDIDHRRQIAELWKHVDDGLSAFEHCGGEDVVDAHEQTAGDDGRDDRDEDVGEHLDETLYRAALAFFGFIRRAVCNGSDLFLDLIADEVDEPRSQDDLELAVGHERSFDDVDIRDGVFIAKIRILELKTKAGGTMLNRADVVFSADLFNDL